MMLVGKDKLKRYMEWKDTERVIGDVRKEESLALRRVVQKTDAAF